MVANDGERAAHLERSRRVWDLWSQFYGFNDRDTEPVRRRAVETLALTGGETVLDVGCGPGSNFELLRERVGPGGRVVGVDYSPKMVAKARARVENGSWDSVDVIRADATRPVVLPESVDAAVATLALSAMPDAREASARRRVHRPRRRRNAPRRNELRRNRPQAGVRHPARKPA